MIEFELSISAYFVVVEPISIPRQVSHTVVDHRVWAFSKCPQCDPGPFLEGFPEDARFGATQQVGDFFDGIVLAQVFLHQPLALSQRRGDLTSAINVPQGSACLLAPTHNLRDGSILALSQRCGDLTSALNVPQG